MGYKVKPTFYNIGFLRLVARQHSNNNQLSSRCLSTLMNYTGAKSCCCGSCNKELSGFKRNYSNIYQRKSQSFASTTNFSFGVGAVPQATPITTNYAPSFLESLGFLFNQKRNTTNRKKIKKNREKMLKNRSAKVKTVKAAAFRFKYLPSIDAFKYKVPGRAHLRTGKSRKSLSHTTSFVVRGDWRFKKLTKLIPYYKKHTY